VERPPSRGIDPNLVKALGELLREQDVRMAKQLDEARAEFRRELRSQKPSYPPKRLSDVEDGEEAGSGIFELTRKEVERVIRTKELEADARVYRGIVAWAKGMAVPLGVVVVIAIAAYLKLHVWK
jgi:hypothetical protein